MRIVVLSVLAVLLAGCAQQPSPASGPAIEPQSGPASEAPDVAGPPAPPALAALYLQADLTLAPAPAASEAYVAPAVVANGPWVDDDEYPTWTAQLADGAPNGTANVTFFVTSSSASFAAPEFVDLPQFTVALGDGANESQVPAGGPDVIRTGEVVEVHAQVPLDGLRLAPGTTLWLRLQPYYSQVKAAEEIRFVVGPDHPARVEFAKSLMP